MSGEVTANGNYLRRTTGYSGAITVCTWFRLLSVTGFHTIWSQDDNANFYPGLYTDTTNLRFVQSGISDVVIKTGLAANTWYWTGIVYETGVNAEFYTGLGGALTHTTGAVSGGGYPATAMTLFDENAADQNLNGELCAFKAWTGRLSSDEMTYEYLKGNPQRALNLDVFLPSTNGVAAWQGIDMSGQGHNFTKTGTISTARTMPPITWSR
jgi:hypothetical protein